MTRPKTKPGQQPPCPSLWRTDRARHGPAHGFNTPCLHGPEKGLNLEKVRFWIHLFFLVLLPQQARATAPLLHSPLLSPLYFRQFLNIVFMSFTNSSLVQYKPPFSFFSMLEISMGTYNRPRLLLSVGGTVLCSPHTLGAV